MKSDRRLNFYPLNGAENPRQASAEGCGTGQPPFVSVIRRLMRDRRHAFDEVRAGSGLET